MFAMPECKMTALNVYISQRRIEAVKSYVFIYQNLIINVASVELERTI